MMTMKKKAGKRKRVQYTSAIVAQAGAVILLACQHSMSYGFFMQPMTLPRAHNHHDRPSVLQSVHLEPPKTSIVLSTSHDAERRMRPTRLYSMFHKTANDDHSRVSHPGLVRFWTRIQQKLKNASTMFVARRKRNKNSLAVDADNGDQGMIHGAAILEETAVNLNGPATPFQPSGTRWAMATPTIQLSGNWRPIVTPAFRKLYDEYLQNCSEPLLPRKLITSLLHTTREVIDHSGRNLTITSTNPAGTWSRTLISSGTDYTFNKEEEQEDYDVILSEIMDPDKESVTVESWWDDNGTVHRSVLRGKSRFRGGMFETLRYLEKHDPRSSDSVVGKDKADDILIVESFFRPSPESQGFRNGHVQWRFERE